MENPFADILLVDTPGTLALASIPPAVIPAAIARMAGAGAVPVAAIGAAAACLSYWTFQRNEYGVINPMGMARLYSTKGGIVLVLVALAGAVAARARRGLGRYVLPAVFATAVLAVAWAVVEGIKRKMWIDRNNAAADALAKQINTPRPPAVNPKLTIIGPVKKSVVA